MSQPDQLLQNNRAWSAQIRAREPDFFSQLAQQQNPQYLWIGCSDSRVPANQIVGLMPGEIFVHRNVGNVVVHTDLNCLSVLQFAVDVIAVRHVLVVGHYGCSGVLAALESRRIGLCDNWLRHIQDVRLKHFELIERSAPESRHDRLCELNVIEQVVNVCQTTIVHDAWDRGQALCVHGWVYSLTDGLIRDLGITVSRSGELPDRYAEAISALGVKPDDQPACASD